MSQHPVRPDHANNAEPINVRAPRIGDRLGHALAAAFEPDDDLPNDLLAMLTQIDRPAGPDCR